MNALRYEFEQLSAINYLNHAAISPWPQRTVDAVNRFSNENARLGARNYSDWLATEHLLRERLARLVNAPSSDDIALVKNTSQALSYVAFGLDWQPGDQVVISDEEFPSNKIVWQALNAQGVEVKQVNLANSDPETALLDACGPRTRLLSISAVQFASGLRLNLQRLGHGCREKGVLFCVDAIQQIGALPFDVQACGCDFAMADGHKWMLGPEGLGLFYCRSELREQLKLHEYGWHMLEHAGDYSRTDWQPAKSAVRFESGSPNMLGTMALEASLSLLEEVGMVAVGQALEERVLELTTGLGRISGVNLHSPLNPERRAGIINFSLDGWDTRALFEKLKQDNLICAQRGKGIRLSPHFYTKPEVIESTLRLIRQASGR
ncbi:aminotransferase class V-fold PLP-dependent enzyme [Pseudomonas segetis]|uniref:Selenocysteine lyase/Cysteine desulfurase n=1 Tax=Pseudomonas segetis TaxID=298908 RepID=A0A239HUV5_9PSED|nr:aminotransferase class V-fold PLP-dependent enzyme [Pseudomonas segetis]SNS85126.1 Selenocysteine lyase/Cysteine desulfurase [Pseudomonas segetis]